MKPDYSLDGRVAHDLDRAAFLKQLAELQVPCPWGDLQNREGIKEFVEDMPELDLIPHVPLGLVLGCGHRPYPYAYRGVACADTFGKIIFSDIINPYLMPEDYVKLNLINPEMVNLFGYRVHAVMSIGVFTYDSLGVNFPSRKIEMKTAQAISDLLMPGGIIANDNLYSFNGMFEWILQDKFGFKEFKIANSGMLHATRLQKPF